jgi:peptidoglycan hydrolase-like protein with peptidoglycan-binding domain
MKTWSSAMAMLAAGAMLAGVAHGQTTPSSEQKTSPGGAAGKSDSMKSEGSTKSGALKSDSTKSDGAMKSHRGGRMAASREQVKAAQQALKDKGHDPGAVDGVMGPKTQAALRDFQGKEGLKTTGRLDTDTMSKLGVEAKTGAAADTRSTMPSASPQTGSGATSSSPGTSAGGTK